MLAMTGLVVICGAISPPEYGIQFITARSRIQHAREISARMSPPTAGIQPTEKALTDLVNELLDGAGELSRAAISVLATCDRERLASLLSAADATNKKTLSDRHQGCMIFAHTLITRMHTLEEYIRQNETEHDRLGLVNMHIDNLATRLDEEKALLSKDQIQDLRMPLMNAWGASTDEEMKAHMEQFELRLRSLPEPRNALVQIKSSFEAAAIDITRYTSKAIRKKREELADKSRWAPEYLRAVEELGALLAE